MMQRLRSRLTYANVAATLALVLAMSGGAYAATRVIITSEKQIAKSVLRKLKAPGAKGLTGAAGSAGPTGPQGLAGAAGKDGTSGANGTDGVSVTSKALLPKVGPPCESGGSEFTAAAGKVTYACNGTTGFTESLPSEKTETGTWTDQVFGSSESRPTIGWSSISFAIPLESALNKEHVFFVEPEAASPPEQCQGNVANPTAQPGNLCVYASFMSEIEPLFGVIHDPSASGGGFITENGAGRSGAWLSLKEAGTEGGSAFGTWAVTAP